MERVGKRDVWIITHVPGNPPQQVLSYRMVYRNQDGIPHINWHRGKRQVEESTIPETFELHLTYRPITIMTGADFMGGHHAI